MTKYAMIYQERFIPLTRSGTLEQAQEVACEELWDFGADRDSRFKIIEIANEIQYDISEFDAWFEKKLSEWQARKKQQEEWFERQQFERLKKKFDNCTCSEKQVDKTN